MNEEYEIKKLKRENAELQRMLDGDTPSTIEKFRNSNKNLKERNKRLRLENEANSRKIRDLQKQIDGNPKKGKATEFIERRKASSNIAKMSSEEREVYNRMLRDFNSHSNERINEFPGADHIVFDHLYELADQYPNHAFLRKSIRAKIDHYKHIKDLEIKECRENIKALNEIAKLESAGEPLKDIPKDIINLYETTTVDDIKDKIASLEDDKENIDKWQQVTKRINHRTKRGTEELQNNLYYEIMNEFEKLYFFITNLNNLHTYKGNINIVSDKKDDMLSGLAEELEKKIGLCEEPTTRTYYYNNGEGRLVPWKHNPNILAQIQNGTTFIKHNKNDIVRRSGRLISSPELFEKVPNWVQQAQYKNQDLVGFNNTFYSISKREVQNLDFDVPLLPLRNTQTELYLDEKIDGGAMEHIFRECFTKEDAEALLCYLGCCLYDKGYTQRQESIFLLSKGETGKTTFIKAICEIFYSWESQIVTKLSDAKFGLSMFGENDCIIIDEIQGANEDFAEMLKTISTGSNLAIEKKNKDTINIPAEQVPRCWFIGNQFPKKMYDRFAGEGVFRRVLVIVPKASIKDLGYQWKDLITDNCKQWLVQQATKLYVKYNLDVEAKPIPTISDEEKMNRVEKCTYPERYLIGHHFDVAYDEHGKLDKSESISYTEMHNFVHQCILDEMLEPTVKVGNSQTFSIMVKNALKVSDGYHGRMEKGELMFDGVIPKSDEAIKYFR